jgi:ribonuclease HI
MRDAERLSAGEGLRLAIYIDGASKGNPGEAGAGVWIADEEGKKLAAFGRYLGNKTNNEAEYWALLLGIREAKRLGGVSIRVYTDSELIQRQVKGIYRVKDWKLKALHKRVLQEVKGFSSFEIESIPREQNREADRLANQAIQRRIASKKVRKQEGHSEEGYG